MRLKNTSRYPTEEVRRLVEFAMRGVNTARLEVHVKNAHDTAYRGRAYNGVPSVSSANGKRTVDRLVTIGIGPQEKFPTVDWGSRRYKSVPEFHLGDWREALVSTAAHEARHIQQMQRRKPLSEVDCIRFEFKRLTEYREAVA